MTFSSTTMTRARTGPALLALVAMIAAFLVLVVPQPASAQATGNLVVNGSFELGPKGNRSVPTGWQTFGIGGRWEDTRRASDGAGFYAMNGWGDVRNSVIRQTVPTSPGQLYRVSFNATKFRGANTDVYLSSVVNPGPNFLGDTRVLLGAAAEFTYTFTATGTSVNLEFRDFNQQGGSDYDMDLDDVRVEAIGGLQQVALVNGDFEQGGVGPGVAPTGWTISGTGGRHESAGRAANGVGYYAIDGWGNGRDGSIEQTFTTKPGQQYEVRYSTRSRTPGTLSALSSRVFNGADEIGGLTFTVGSRTERSFTFSAASTSTTLRFSDRSGSGGANYDIDLDAVSIFEI